MSKKDAIIYTEGKTDWKHIKRAIAALGMDLNVEFNESDKNMGDQTLLKQCKFRAEMEHPIPVIHIFDRDTPNVVNEVTDDKGNYKNWGNNVYSLALPVPEHRTGYTNLCIELYYSDQDLKTQDKNGRRLFLTSEFDENSGKHKENPLLSFGIVPSLKKDSITTLENSKIIDSEVYGEVGNVALTKSDFADYIADGVNPFHNFDFSPFQLLLNQVQQIIEMSKPSVTIFFPKQSDQLIGTPSEQLIVALETIYKVVRLFSMIFIGSTIRYYQSSIVDESDGLSKRVRPIKNLISESFREPSLGTLQTMVRYCYHLVNNDAPDELLDMKDCFSARPQLQSIGSFLDDLERLSPSEKRSVRIANKSDLRKEVLQYIIPEFAQHERNLSEILDSLKDPTVCGSISVATWQAAQKMITDIFSPILQCQFRARELKTIDSLSRKATIYVSTFSGGKRNSTEQVIEIDDVEKVQDYTCEIQLSGSYYDLYPFLRFNDDRIHYYYRNSVSGYDYRSTFDSNYFIDKTKIKFSRYVFANLADDQSIFWTEIIPTVNTENGIRANIPIDSLVDFVGRHRQIRRIFDEIIEIPNQNGIIFGPGGVGKTALMLEITRRLYENTNTDDQLYDNIIWVSAKRDYYNHTFDLVEKDNQQFRTLDNVLSLIFEFFEYGDMDEYDHKDRKELMLELLKEHKILLVLDNFESISKAEKDAIIRFFGVEAKKALRKHPDNFKILITSREQIPSGFHQIALSGLDATESKQLMRNLYQPYRSSSEDLTDQQKNAVHEVTSGIPVVVKHCYGQIFEFNRAPKDVLYKLSRESSAVIEFSFAEIFNLLKADHIQLQILILLELFRQPLLIRQIADITEIDEPEVSSKLPPLVNFQCVKSINSSGETKYGVNDDVRLFTVRLTQEYGNVTKEIKKKIAKNYTVDKQMDYTTEELSRLIMFQDYLADERFADAEDFMKKELSERPDSILLNFEYAKYLKEYRRNPLQAIDILKTIRQKNSHPSILSFIITCYLSQDIPNYNEVDIYARELLNNGMIDDSMRLDIAEFYVKWSTSIKMQSQINPLDEMIRQQRYKDLADEALDILSRLHFDNHKVQYLTAQSHYNKWDYTSALYHIGKALEVLPENSPVRSNYLRFRYEAQDKQQKYAWQQ